jgi:hypothetical protein
MPIRQRATPLLAFGFNSTNCVKFPGHSEKHSNMVVRIRKDDLANIDSNALHGGAQVYVRVPETEPLAIDIGTSIHIDTKKRELRFVVSSIYILTGIKSRTRFYRTAVLSGRFA